VADGRWTFGAAATFDTEAGGASFTFDPVCGVAVVTSGISIFGLGLLMITLKMMR
jgi:hypothetical protein